MIAIKADPLHTIYMIKKIFLFIILCFIFTGALLAYRGVITLPWVKNDAQKSSGIIWGVYTSAYAFKKGPETFTQPLLDMQEKYIKDLGVSLLRAKYETYPDSQEANDAVVNLAQKNKLELLLVLEPPLPDLMTQLTYQVGYDWGKKVATRYKGRVGYYQLTNEVSGVVIKPSHPGTKDNDYDEAKYQKLKTYLQGLSTGIHDGDKNAKRVITANWISTAIIDRMYKDKVAFDIIGWNWFSDMGDDPTHKVLDDGSVLDLPTYFAKYKKPFWITEANESHGDFDDPTGKKQAEYFNTLSANIIKSGKVDAFIAFKLFDSHSEAQGKRTPDTSWGLVGQKVDAKRNYIPGSIKPAYSAYQEIIKNYVQAKS